MRNKYLLVDGMALLFRSFYATSLTGQFMINQHGVPTNAVQGFLKHLWHAMDEVTPTHTIICWDMGSTTFRTEEYAAYKANRSAPPVEMEPQFGLVREITDELGFHSVGVVNYEADDCIGTIMKQLKDENVVVLSGDKDLLQLLDVNHEVWLLQKGYGNYAKWTVDSFKDEYGINPNQLIDVKGLMGDPSDGYPGVKGVGEKTALKWIQQFGSVESLLENISSLTKTQQTKINTHLDDLHLSKKLAAIHCEVPLSFQQSDGKTPESTSMNWEFLDHHGMGAVKRYLVTKSFIA
ncbi:5'-3' exonuclease [Mangrovibacillus cuniculi]|uniref:5'-3' exonuclease n=1 Tax=Mangrovibacillus cuniculi TaxID=2593652 RepID=A0A7S8CB83_9BACI|nr:5'-3' exonuclease [Mangrovibacillus cuniculi]QPC46646.1 5'-3' exonuclease [Mangrovibacillus cuniculi]